MAGEIQLNGTTALTESSGAITLNNVNSETNRTNLGMGGFTGMIASFAMSSAPTGWLVCNGAEYAIATYGDLYTAIGTTWGALTNGSGGAGSTHFRVPDLQGAFLRGIGNGTINARTKTGPTNVGDFQEDQFETHYHSAGNMNYGQSLWTSGVDFAGGSQSIYFDTSDPDNGRHGSETRVYNAGIQYCIKY